MRNGDVVPGVPLSVIQQSPSSLAADGHWGFGQVQARRLTQLLIAKAHTSPVVMGTMIHCGHIGRLGEYCELAAADNMVSILMVNTHGSARRVAPPGGKAPRLGTNPLAFGSPAPGRTVGTRFRHQRHGRGQSTRQADCRRPVPRRLAARQRWPTHPRSQRALCQPAGHDPANGRQPGLQGVRSGVDGRDSGRRRVGRGLHSRDARQPERQLRVHADHRSHGGRRGRTFYAGGGGPGASSSAAVRGSFRSKKSNCPAIPSGER